MKKRTGWAYVLLMAFLLAGCDRQTAFHAFRSLSEQGWNRQDTVCFPLSDAIMDENEGVIEVEVRAVRAYPYEHVWLAIVQTDSLSRVMHTDTLCIDMTDAKGNFMGHGMNFLEYRSDAVPLATDSLGTCRQVSICHLMEREQITGLTDVGIKVSRRVPTMD